MGVPMDEVVFGTFEVIGEAASGVLSSLWLPRLVDNILVEGV